MLVRLLYASRAADGVTADAVHAIVRQSKASNPGRGITGLLCCAEGVFLQVLEGSRGAVNRLYARILADARHRDVELLAYEEIAERCFAGWAMGQVHASRVNPALLLKYCETASMDPYAMSGAAATALFRELVATASIAGAG